RHASLLPAIINLGMTVFAGCRTHVMRGATGRQLLCGHLWRQGSDPGQMPQIRAHLPELSIGKRPPRHASVSDAILEVVKQLAVAHALNISAAQIRRPWILAAADLGFAAAIVGMANFALLCVYV